jgi:hypothetical protein
MTINSCALQPRKNFDWKLAAEMLAAGAPTIAVAQHIGCSRQHVWKMMRNSDAFRARLHTTHERLVVESHADLDALRGDVVAILRQEIMSGNVRVAMWLAQRMGLVGPIFPARATANESAAVDPVAEDPDARLDLDDAGNIARQDAFTSPSTVTSVENQQDGELTVNVRQLPSTDSATAPVAANDAIASGEYPSSPSTSAVCWPSSGAALVTAAGVAENFTGGPSVATRPSVG